MGKPGIGHGIDAHHAISQAVLGMKFGLEKHHAEQTLQCQFGHSSEICLVTEN